MVHDEAWEMLLAGYVDQSLDPHRSRMVEAHLATCSKCADAIRAASAGARAARAAAGAEAPPPGQDDAAFLAAVERRAARALAAAGGADSPRPDRKGWRAPFAALGDVTQVRPALWFFLSLPVYGLYMAPSAGLLALAAAGLLLAFLMEYAITWEASRYDSR